MDGVRHDFFPPLIFDAFQRPCKGHGNPGDVPKNKTWLRYKFCMIQTDQGGGVLWRIGC